MGGGTVKEALEKVVANNTGKPERAKKEFIWQWNMGNGDADAIKDIILAPSSDFKAYAMVQPGSTVIKIVHSISKYYGVDETPVDLHGKVIGFHGERTRFGPPKPVVLPPQSTFKWVKTNICTDEVAWATAHAAATTNHEFWVPTGNKTMHELPRLLSVPAKVALYCMEQPRTARDVYLWVTTLVNEDDAIEAEDVNMVKKWMMAAGQKEQTRNSAVALEAQVVMEAHEGFNVWCERILMGNLGTPVSTAAAPTPPAQPQQDFTQAGFQLLANAIANNRAGQAVAPPPVAEKQTKDPYTKFELARIMGYSQKERMADCSPIWADFLTTNKAKEHRKMLKDRMQEWNKQMGTGLNFQGIYPTNEQMKQIVGVNFEQDGSPLGLLKESEKGVSNLTCLPLDHETIVQIMQDEEDEEATKHTRTYTDLKKKLRNITHTPPSNYTELKLNIAMWAAMVWALFTETCPLYIQLMQLYMLLVSNYCDAIKTKFTGPVVRSVCWAIFEGSKEFFAQ